MNYGMIIASRCLDQIDRVNEVYMSTGDHLTIRDYFDQVFVGKQRTRKIYSRSPQHANGSATTTFHRMLASRQMQGLRHANVKSTGLTIQDYLANPLRVKGPYQRSPELLSSVAKEIRSPSRQVLAADKASPAKDTPSALSDETPVSCVRLSAVRPSHRESNISERHKIEKSIQRAARKYNLSPGLIRGVIQAESNFRVNVVSRAGAQGLMQLMPATAKELGVTKPLDIDQNIDGGARYLRKMLDRFGGDVKLALAAYNAGPGTVRKYAGNVPYRETIQYVNRVMRFSEQTT
jgi:soluble lytic murein transglycosylase-like protein